MSEDHNKEEEASDKIIIRVKASTNIHKLAKAIYKMWQGKDPEKDLVIRTIGAGPVNQAMKAVIVSNRDFIRQGLIATVLPTFMEFDSEESDHEELITSIEFRMIFSKIKI